MSFRDTMTNPDANMSSSNNKKVPINKVTKQTQYQTTPTLSNKLECDGCTYMKLKCSGMHPCTNCLKAEKICQFPNQNNLSLLQAASLIDKTKIGTQQTSMQELIESKHTINLDQIPPLTAKTGNNGFYKDDIKIVEMLSNIQKSILQLKSTPNTSDQAISNGEVTDPGTLSLVEQLNKQANNIIRSWKPEVDMNKLNEEFKDFDYSKQKKNHKYSVETYLMKNKYRDVVHITSVSAWSGKQSDSNSGIHDSQISSYLAHQPVVDWMFGLYDPGLIFSLRGIGQYIRNITSDEQTTQDHIQIKETIYLLLRLFDVITVHISQYCVSISHPLESFLEREAKVEESLGNSPIIHVNMSTPPSIQDSLKSPTSSTYKDLVTVLINKLPFPFVEEITKVSRDKLFSTIESDFAMFHLVLQMFGSHKEAYDNFMINTKRDSNGNISSDSLQVFFKFSKQQEILLALAYHYYTCTFYHFDAMIVNIEYFELLLSLLDYQVWLSDLFGYEKVLSVAMNYAAKLGLYQWEFYVGLPEGAAERRRKLLWRLYCYEKIWSTTDGLISLIDEKNITFLLTKEFRTIGFSNNKDFIERVHLLPVSSDFDRLSLEELCFYGVCGSLQISSHFSTTTLYNEKFTSIKNTSLPSIFQRELINELFDEVNLTLIRLEALGKHTSKLFEIVRTNGQCLTEYLEPSLYIKIYDFVLSYYHNIVTVIWSVSNLMSRFIYPDLYNYYKNKIQVWMDRLGDVWWDMVTLLLNIDNDYILSHSLKFFLVASILTANKTFSVQKDLEPKYVFAILRVLEKIQNIAIYKEISNNKIVKDTILVQEYSRSHQILSIIAHTLLLIFKKQQKISKAQLFRYILLNAPDVADLPPALLDPKSYIFKPLMEPVDKSGFHLSMSRMLEKDKRFSSDKKEHDKNDHLNLTNDKKNDSTSAQTNNLMASNINSDVNNPMKNISLPNQMPQHIPNNIHSLNVASPKISKYINSSNINNNQPSRKPSIKNMMGLDEFSDINLATRHNTNVIDATLNSSPVSNRNHPEYKSTISLSNSNISDVPNNYGSIMDDSNPNIPLLQGYDLGTLDEFLDHGDLDDLWKTIWSDVYTDDTATNLTGNRPPMF
ncbi:hypothetical protein TBLA_0A09040 [Henningerozyma blattae CBS 6284]|uniref:Zn(2)-C6 fungal-type domain-containing protein n=1 Tax=Henningerozyma blattae (strain ATCC 34711 / CBS 6284 / DSM 70876 / NBRC 10599 / NRRL Y-10934 / UCD 77-7) TaxID=1071380 RepID=I2GX40_HENB6|nr:hypothetical protein TBLA_0A09040 [Tetrapisispora blattae CBS 6284]CCH58692.1 hypothetical protein TBLA_0A09040 [Tetrapisispora blattae CBS 6284]